MIDLEKWDVYVNDRYLSEYVTPADFVPQTETLFQIEENRRVATAKRKYAFGYTLLEKQRDAIIAYSVEQSIKQDDPLYWIYAEQSLDAFYNMFTYSLAARIVGIQPIAIPKNLMYKIVLVESGFPLDGCHKTMSLALSDQLPEEMYGSFNAAYRTRPASLMSTAIQSSPGYLTKKFTNMINGHVVKDLIRLANNNPVEEVEVDLSADSNIPLLCRINANCSDIARMTRRGAGNFIVVNRSFLHYFDKDAHVKKFMPLSDDEIGDQDEPIGTFNAIDIYINNNIPDNTILAGYKGQHSEYDTGYILNPIKIDLYTMHGNNSDWQLGIFSLDCKNVIITPTEDEFNKASDYYRVIKVIPKNG